MIRKRRRTEGDRFLSLDNPTGDLTYTKTQLAKIRSFFIRADALSREQATQANLVNYPHRKELQCLHFFCHGKFNFTAPLESALSLADKPMKLGDIFGLTLPNCRLVTLSACETGLIAPNELSDEYVGLPSGFILAGSNAVICSLWAVEELATALFMIEFYRRFKAGERIELALKSTQFWFRNADKESLRKWVQVNGLSLDAVQQEALEIRLNRAEEIPFASVYYWGAFALVGE